MSKKRYLIELTVKKQSDPISKESMFCTLRRKILIAPSNISSIDQLSVLISEGESNILEFKSSLRWDYQSKNKNIDLEFLVLRAITSFLNGDGGNLIIGVSDNGAILGLEPDYSTFKEGSRDKYELHLTQLIINALTITRFKDNCKIDFFIMQGKEICVIAIKLGSKPVFLTKNGKDHFFVRAGNSSREILSPAEIAEYCIMRFGTSS